MIMPIFSAYVSGNDFRIGTMLSIASRAFEGGDTLSIGFPDGSRTSGAIVSALPNELEVEINLRKWRLRPHAPSDGTLHNNQAGSDASFWTVQTLV
jgi:hypothetical protein